MDGRNEYKYLVPNALLDTIREEIMPYMQHDPFGEGGGLREYTVRSMYYDTPGYDCYLEKIDGVANRQKYRIRGYGEPNSESMVFLEIKMKRGCLISKHRAPLKHSDLYDFLDSPDVEGKVIPMRGFPGAQDCARRFLYHYFRNRLRPAVLVVYNREAFLGRFDPTLRMTFDKRVRGAVTNDLTDLYSDRDLIMPLPRHFVFEVKFFRGALPAWAQNVITKHSMQRMAVSKYAMCLDSSQSRRGTARLRRAVLNDAVPA